MKIPIVKEWGSWVVFLSSVLTALITGLRLRPWEGERDFASLTIITVLGLVLLINSKSPLASVLRTRGENRESFLWLLFFSISGLVLLVPFLIDGIRHFAFFSVLALTYIILLYRGKEHSLITELNGFALLTLSAPVVYFAATGELSLRLYAAVLLFFGAGVFKVRVRIRKTLKYRWIMAAYCGASAVVYYVLDIPLVMLLPLSENIISVILMREEKLRATGYTEMTKGIIFILLTGLFWH